MVSGEKRIDLLLLIVAHALVLSGLFCVILTHEIPVALWLCALAAHPLSFLMRPRAGGLFFNSLVILSFIYALFLFFVLQTPFLVAFTQFLIVVQAVKLFHLEKAKDYFQLAGLSLLMVLAAAGLTTQLYYLFFLFLLLLFGIWFLFLLQLKRAREQHPGLPHPPRTLTSPSLFMGITGVALCSFIITILIFFTLPRITLSVSGRERWGETSSGFSDVVDLGTVGPVRLDNRVVMRVELPQLSERPAAPLYWRGMSFARWDGQSWAKEGTVEEIPREPGGRVRLRREVGGGGTKAIYQIIMLEPLGTDILFCLHPALEIRGSFARLVVDKGGGIHLPSAPQERYNYEVYSALQPGERHRGAAERPAEVYLQLPEKKEAMVALARQIVAKARSPEEKINRVIAYLQGNFTYSLNPRRDKRFLPLEDFLLHSREGYCEHFATAAAILLREAGVPTRLVSGFLQGEWNSLGRYFMVRQRDAHTWIEAYLPEKGWVPFDPTPAAPAQALVPAIASFYRYYDFLKLQWNRYIIRYSRRDQIRILLALHQKVMGLRLFPHSSPFPGVREKVTRPSPYVLAAVALAACILFIAWRWKKKRYRGTKRAGKLPAEISFYLMMLKILEKKKMPKLATETPAEFADRVGKAEATISPSLERITSLYYRVRFGQFPLTPHEEEEAGEIIRDLKKKGPLSPSPIAGGS
jgi:protein-glutamine gamma-glutamyltransferase